MENSVLVIMKKNPDTGFLEKELATYTLFVNQECIVRIYVEEIDSELISHLFLSCPKDNISDSEYDAIFDYYDSDIFKMVSSVSEVEGDMNPVWHFIFPYSDNPSQMEALLEDIIQCHEAELESVYIAIADEIKRNDEIEK